MTGLYLFVVWLDAIGDDEINVGAREALQAAEDWAVLVLLLLAEVRLEDVSC